MRPSPLRALPKIRRHIARWHNGGPHKYELIRHFGADACRYPADTGPIVDSFTFLIFQNRSGSNLLADYLRASGQFCGLGEWLNEEHVRNQCAKRGFETFFDYMKTSISNARGRANAAFGLKASEDQFRMLQDFGFVPAMAERFNYIYIRRRDLTDQAISLAIAAQTKRWASFHTGNGKTPEITFHQIDRKRATIRRGARRIEKLFEANGISPYRVDYEDLVETPVEIAQDICRTFTGKVSEIDESRIRFKKQAGEMSRQIKEAYLTHKGLA